MGPFFRFFPAWPARYVAVLLVSLLCCGLEGCNSHHDSAVQAQGTNNGETIVLIRHGEIADNGMGQLNCGGLNRALALPKVFSARFPIPSAIFAPDPTETISEDGGTYSYVRPLATIEPTAIALRLPVNTHIGYTNVAALQTAVTASTYADSTVLIAWEHSEAYQFAQNLVKAYGQDPSEVPSWSSGDFEMMYVFHISLPSAGSKLTFQVQQEDLTGSLTNTCPT